MTQSPAIEVANLTFRYGDRMVLDGVTFCVPVGGYLSIVGPNGAGKSTLLKCLNRILTPKTGHLRLLGRPLASYSQKELASHVCYVPQAESADLPFTVREFVTLGRYPHLSPFTAVGPEDRRVVDEMLERTTTSALANRMMKTLSGGERQKVYIAAALAQGAGIMLLDEPVTFLDPHHQVEVHQMLKRLNQDCQVTIVAVTHDLNSAVLASRSILAIREGRIVHDGTPATFMHNDVLEAVFGRRFLFVAHPVHGQPMVLPEGME